MVADRRADCGTLTDIADNRRRRMGIDVRDIRSGQSSPLDRVFHRLDLADPVRMVTGDVVRIGGYPVPGEVAVDLGATCFGVLGSLQNHGSGSLTEHEPVAIDVERAGRGA